MTFDFLILIALILVVFLTVVGMVTHAGIWNLLTVPLLLYLIVKVIPEADSTLPVLGLSGIIAFQVFFALRGVIGGGSEE